MTRSIFGIFQKFFSVKKETKAYSSPKMSRPNPSPRFAVGSPGTSDDPGEKKGSARRQYHPELLNKAVQLVTEKGMSIANVSEVMGIPVTTLWRKVKAKDPTAVGRGSPSGRGRGRGGGNSGPPPPPQGFNPSFLP